ncbi:MAG TPA: SDR family oxidoreductase [Acidimicrobiales bacterium]|nr:SDR family oxidoreductase [Acidimicrobiales bacterium]
MRLAGKVALITGAGSGIGRAASLLFAREGAAVVAVDRDRDSAEQTVAQIRAAGEAAEVDDAGGPGAERARRGAADDATEAIAVVADVAVAADCEAMVAAAEAAFGRLDVLFNNAGVMLAADGDAVDTGEGTWATTMDVNAKGVFLGCKYGIPALRRAGGGSIVNTASFVARLGAATPQLAYTASKGAVLALTRELAVIHAREGIRVNALCPGPLRTELLMRVLDSDEKRRRRLVHIPMGRFGEADEIAKAALFLASDDASFMTGAEMLVDGGLTAAYVTPE